MLKALVFLFGPLASAGLVLMFGLPALFVCAALAVGTLLLSTSKVAESAGFQFDYADLTADS